MLGLRRAVGTEVVHWLGANGPGGGHCISTSNRVAAPSGVCSTVRASEFLPSQIELRAAYMPDAAWAVSVHPPSLSRKMGQPPVLTSSSRFRHFIDGSLAFASLNHACRNLVPAFPQRSPPSLLTTAACGGLRSTPDCRPRRAFLHLSYSYAAPCGPALLVTQGQQRKFW